MTNPLAKMWRRWSVARLPLTGRDLYVVRHGDGDLAAPDALTLATDLDRVLHACLRTRAGHRLSAACVRDLSLDEKKIAFIDIVQHHGVLQGVPMFGKPALRLFVPADRAAPCESALNELAKTFIARRMDLTLGLYHSLRASAAATVA
jgi:hypothetical protein